MYVFPDSKFMGLLAFGHGDGGLDGGDAGELPDSPAPEPDPPDPPAGGGGPPADPPQHPVHGGDPDWPLWHFAVCAAIRNTKVPG